MRRENVMRQENLQIGSERIVVAHERHRGAAATGDVVHWQEDDGAWRRVFVRKVRDLVVDYDERGGSAVEYVIESFAEVAPNMYSGDPESQKARALYIAENFDARVKRSSFSRGVDAPGPGMAMAAASSLPTRLR